MTSIKRTRERRLRWDVKKPRTEAQRPEADSYRPDTVESSLEKRATAAVEKTSKWSELEKSSKKPDIPTFNDIPLTSQILSILLPDNYTVLPPPSTPSSPIEAPTEYNIPTASTADIKALSDSIVTSIPGNEDLEYVLEADTKYFGKLLSEKQLARTTLTPDELRDQRVMRLLLNIKNGSQVARKTSLRTITETARELGPKALFNNILPLLMEPSLSDRERHLLVKVISRVLFRLDDLVRPYTEKILRVVSPLLNAPSLIIRLEARDIVLAVVKAAGLAHTVTTLRNHIDLPDDALRQAAARTFAVAASALGIQNIIPFLRALCKSKKLWSARLTGARIAQNIAILCGCGVLPHLNALVQCVLPGLEDENVLVRRATAVAFSALAEASKPYGIEAFEPYLDILWEGLRRHRGGVLAAYLRAAGHIIPLMEPEHAAASADDLLKVVLREFASSDEDMRRTVLKVVQESSSVEGVSAQMLRTRALPALGKHFWNRRTALDMRSLRLVVETTVVLAKKVGVPAVTELVLPFLKDLLEHLRRMAVDGVLEIYKGIEALSLTERTEQRLVDGLLVALQKPPILAHTVTAFGRVTAALDLRAKPYLPQIVLAVLYRVQNENPEVRQQAVELVGALVVAIRTCGEDELLTKLSKVLYELLGEAYPEVLAEILHTLCIVIKAAGVGGMRPLVAELVPSLAPVLRNRHEKVQEHVIALVGLVAENAAEHVPPREWMRICFELLDLLKLTKKLVRRAANSTFGHIARAIGPQEVLVTLLNNLRVQERQLRVCTAVAIGIVAETCQPFTVVALLMNEYRTPEKNVQNGVLKAMGFMFEYLEGSVSKDYIYAVVPMLEDALVDRDQIHRQTAATVVKHMAINSVGLGLEDVYIHFLNLLMPNIYETSPHVIARVIDGLGAIRMAIGTGAFMGYILEGLWHCARKVRTPYWRLYNDAYMASQDAMVPYFPAGNREEGSVWEGVDELNIVL